MFLKIFTEKYFFVIHYRSSLPYSKALCKEEMASEQRLQENGRGPDPLNGRQQYYVFPFDSMHQLNFCQIY